MSSFADRWSSKSQQAVSYGSAAMQRQTGSPGTVTQGQPDQLISQTEDHLCKCHEQTSLWNIPEQNNTKHLSLPQTFGLCRLSYYS